MLDNKELSKPTNVEPSETQHTTEMPKIINAKMVLIDQHPTWEIGKFQCVNILLKF